jgi:hypothetical protein
LIIEMLFPICLFLRDLDSEVQIGDKFTKTGSVRAQLGSGLNSDQKREKHLLMVFLCFSSEPFKKVKSGPLCMTATTPLGSRNSMRNIIELGYCLSIAQIRLKYCSNIAQIMHKHCVNSTQIMLEH